MFIWMTRIKISSDKAAVGLKKDKSSLGLPDRVVSTTVTSNPSKSGTEQERGK